MTDLTTLAPRHETQDCPAHIRQTVEHVWKARQEVQRTTNKAIHREFFIGAMAALDSLGYAAPTSWVLAIEQGRNIC